MSTENEREREAEESASVKRGTYFLWAAGVLLFAAAFFFCGFLFGRVLPGGKKTDSPIDRVLDTVRANYYYYGAETEDSMTVGALKGIAAYLGDPYAYYYAPEEYAELQKSDSGEYTGVGIVITLREDGVCFLSSVYVNGPGEKAGLMTGDVLLNVNGTETEGLTLDAISACFRTNKGEQNTLTVSRGGETLTLTVTAGEVYTPYVYYRMLDERTGYIYIAGFHGKVTEEVKAAVAELQGQGMDRLILDVRNDPGGMFYDVCSIADIFLPEGCVVTTLRGRNGDEKTYRTGKEGLSLPIAMLVNGHSASASELLAGALHDNGAAVLFGTKTYGKGIVQTYYELDSGALGAFKMTTEAYYTPGGVCIQDEGIVPDHIVEMPAEFAYANVYELTPEQDPQLAAALAYLGTL